MKLDYSRKEACARCGGTGKEIDSEALLEMRKDAGLGQAQVSEKMGISASYLSDLEHGRRDWTAEKVEKFMEAIGK